MSQFYELVDLVNQVAITFGEEMTEFDDDDGDDDDGSGGDGEGGSDETQWILDAMNTIKK